MMCTATEEGYFGDVYCKDCVVMLEQCQVIKKLTPPSKEPTGQSPVDEPTMDIPPADE